MLAIDDFFFFFFFLSLSLVWRNEVQIKFSSIIFKKQKRIDKLQTGLFSCKDENRESLSFCSKLLSYVLSYWKFEHFHLMKWHISTNVDYMLVQFPFHKFDSIPHPLLHVETLQNLVLKLREYYVKLYWKIF